jgi:UMF1 family MFS transporter
VNILQRIFYFINNKTYIYFKPSAMQTASKKVINGWAMYDWANSVYNLVITTTFFPIYFTSIAKDDKHSDIVTFLGRKFVNSSLYDYCLAFAYLLIAISYPVLTSIADTRGNKKSFMKFFCYMGSLGCMSMYFFKGTDTLGVGIVGFILAAMGFVGSLVFYNAYLPEIAAPEDQDRVSARGFSFGYIGSVIMQLIGFALVLMMPDAGMATRITFLLVGLWWMGFAQITFSRLPKNKVDTAYKKGNIFKDGFVDVKKVYNQIKTQQVLKRYLRGFFFYSMGVQTVMLAATLFGSKLLALPDTKLIITVVVIQLVAIPGAILMSKLSSKFGNIKVLIGVVLFWILICVAAFTTATLAEPLQPAHAEISSLKVEQAAFTDQGNTVAAANITTIIQQKEKDLDPKQAPIEYFFYGLAIAVGLVMGGIQSLSRSTFSKLMPETKETASYFTYYDLTEKLAIVIGMFSFGLIGEILSMKYSVLSLIIFFAIGMIFLFFTLKKQQELKLA